jgi:hypothetical protein
MNYELWIMDFGLWIMSYVTFNDLKDKSVMSIVSFMSLIDF